MAATSTAGGIKGSGKLVFSFRAGASLSYQNTRQGPNSKNHTIELKIRPPTVLGVELLQGNLYVLCRPLRVRYHSPARKRAIVAGLIKKLKECF